MPVQIPNAKSEVVVVGDQSHSNIEITNVKTEVVVVGDQSHSDIEIQSPAVPDLSLVLQTAVTIPGLDSVNLGDLLIELHEKFEEHTDGLVAGQDFLSYYKLSRDN